MPVPNRILPPNRINSEAPVVVPPVVPPVTTSQLTLNTTGLGDCLTQQTVSGYVSNFQAGAGWSVAGVLLMASKETPTTPKFRTVQREWRVGTHFEIGDSFRYDSAVPAGTIWIGWAAILEDSLGNLWELPLQVSNITSTRVDVVATPFLGESLALTNPEAGYRYVTATNGSATIYHRNPTGLWSPSAVHVTSHRVVAKAFTVPAATPEFPTVRARYFKRKVDYAPKGKRDTRIVSRIYLELAEPLFEGAVVTVTTPGDTTILGGSEIWTAINDPNRISDAIHVNQVGYSSQLHKVGMIGFYQGSGGELRVDDVDSFELIDALTESVVFTGRLAWRRDLFWPATSGWGQQVKVADFSAFTTPGYYQLRVPGLGCSFPFPIHDLACLGWLRLVLRGIMNMRCGEAVGLPYSRQEHVACHTQNVIIPVPQSSWEDLWLMIGAQAGNPPGNQEADVPTSEGQLVSPYVRTAPVSCYGAHHDAGDFGRYTFTVAMTIHHLVLAADMWGQNFDNLGIPESGNGKSDLLDEAKVDADWLLRIQDTDGGFYTLLRPTTRPYDDDQDLSASRPGDQMAAYPKSTQAAAAAVAALAQIGSSPAFRTQFGNTLADTYIAAAEAGWAWLQALFVAEGSRNKAFQKIWHYGMMFAQDDELAWAAIELYLATGNETYHADVLTQPSYTTGVPFNPKEKAWRKWGWWQMYECVGAAARSYALAQRTGRIGPAALRNGTLLANCVSAAIEAADWRLANTLGAAYGDGLAKEYKQNADGAWWFSHQQGFDLAIGYELQTDSLKKAAYLGAYIENWSHALGCNSVNVTYLGGCGLRNHRDCVNQYQQSRKYERSMPPTGFMTGEINKNSSYRLAGSYEEELKKIIFPNLAASGHNNRTPVRDRWWDGFDVLREVTIWEASAATAGAAWLASLEAGSTAQTYTGLLGTIGGVPDTIDQGDGIAAVLTCAGLSNALLDEARVVWEIRGIAEPFQGGPTTKWIQGRTLAVNVTTGGTVQLEAEAHLPDGRVVLARRTFTAQVVANRVMDDFVSPTDPGILARWQFDGNYLDTVSGGLSFGVTGDLFIDSASWIFPGNPGGGALRCLYELGNYASVNVPATLLTSATAGFTIEFMLFVNKWMTLQESGNHGVFKFGLANESKQFRLTDAQYRAGRSVKGNNPAVICTGTQFDSLAPIGTWNHIRFLCNSTGQYLYVNGTLCGAGNVASVLSGWITMTGSILLQVGEFDGWIDDILIRKL